MQINVFLLGKHALNTRLGAKQAVSSVMTYTLVFRGAWMLWPGLVAPPISIFGPLKRIIVTDIALVYKPAVSPSLLTRSRGYRDIWKLNRPSLNTISALGI